MALTDSASFLTLAVARHGRTLWRRSLFRYRVSRAEGDLKLVVGASGIAQSGWIPSEAEFLDLLRPEQWTKALGHRQLHGIVAEHVWEHLSMSDGLTALRTCHRFLKPGGRVRIAVPDGNSPDLDYIEAVRVGGTGPGADDHKTLYTIESLCKLMREAGLSPTPIEYYDTAQTFHRVPWSADEGFIRRSAKNDPRNERDLRYTSLIVDGLKPE